MKAQISHIISSRYLWTDQVLTGLWLMWFVITDHNAPELLNIGSYGIHILYGAHQTAHGTNNWQVGKTLKAGHSVFEKSPARRPDYVSDNGLSSLTEQATKIISY